MRKRTLFQLLGPVSSFVARQLAHPSGWFGRSIMPRVLNRGNRELIVATLDTLVLGNDTRLLDVGFGGGLALRLARQRGVLKLTGIDPSRAAVESLRQDSAQWLLGASLTLLEGGVERLPLEGNIVDGIISTNTVYFWRDLRAASSELYRVLTPGGQLAIGFSSSEKLRQFSSITRHGFLYHETTTLLECATAAGFAAVQLIALTGADTTGDYVLHAKKP